MFDKIYNIHTVKAIHHGSMWLSKGRICVDKILERLNKLPTSWRIDNPNMLRIWNVTLLMLNTVLVCKLIPNDCQSEGYSNVKSISSVSCDVRFIAVEYRRCRLSQNASTRLNSRRFWICSKYIDSIAPVNGSTFRNSIEFALAKVFIEQSNISE